MNAETHWLAERKQQELAKVREAWGLTETVEGEAFNREVQEAKKQARIAEREQKKQEEKDRQEKREKEKKKREKQAKKEAKQREKVRCIPCFCFGCIGQLLSCTAALKAGSAIKLQGDSK